MGLEDFSAAVRAASRSGKPLLAFNIIDPTSLQGILDAAAGRPVIAQCSARTVRFYGARVLRAVVSALAADRPCYLHLDHCADETVLRAAVEAQFDGIMADGSHRSFEENVAWTREWVEAAREHGMVVEGELGAIRGSEDGFAGRGGEGETPDREQYLAFASATGVDLLGADIGTAHGRYESDPVIRFDLLEALAGGNPAGFVVHGGSGLDGPTLRRLAAYRVAKINISTDLKIAWGHQARAALAVGGAVPEPLEALRQGRAAVAEMALGKWAMLEGRG